MMITTLDPGMKPVICEYHVSFRMTLQTAEGGRRNANATMYVWSYVSGQQKT